LPIRAIQGDSKKTKASNKIDLRQKAWEAKAGNKLDLRKKSRKTKSGDKADLKKTPHEGEISEIGKKQVQKLRVCSQCQYCLDVEDAVNSLSLADLIPFEDGANGVGKPDASNSK
jgi:hypothetical protein